MAQNQLSRLDAALRKEFLREKEKAISNIIAAYGGAFQFIIEELLKRKKPGTKKELSKLMSDLAVLQANAVYPVLQDRFKKELTNLGGLGVKHNDVWNSMALALGGLPAMSNRQRQQLATIPNKSYTESLTTFRYNDQTTLSQRIWPKNQQANILATIQREINRGTPFNEIARSIQQYSQTGNGYKNAHRLIFNEGNFAYHNSQLMAARAFNEVNPYYEIVIEQYLSATHKVYDICDVYAGIYLLSEPIPMCPRHVQCNCGQRQRVLAADDAELLAKINGTQIKVQMYARGELFTTTPVEGKFAVDLSMLKDLNGTKDKLNNMEPVDYSFTRPPTVNLVDPATGKEVVWHGVTGSNQYDMILREGFKPGAERGTSEIKFVYFTDKQGAQWYAKQTGGKLIPADVGNLKLVNVPAESWYGQQGKNNGIWMSQYKIEKLMGDYDGIRVMKDGVPQDYAIKKDAANKALGFTPASNFFLRGSKQDIDLISGGVVPNLKPSGGMERPTTNAYDLMFETIERKYRAGGPEHDKYLQALINIIPSNDKAGQSVVRLAGNIYGLKPDPLKKIPTRQYDSIVYK